MPSFHHSVAILLLLFRRSAVVKFRCSVKIIKKIPFHYSRKQQKDTQQQQQRFAETATTNGNSKTATEERQRNGGNRALVPR